MTSRSIAISLIVLLLGFSLVARAQEKETITSLDDNAAIALRKKAVTLLESVASQIEILHSSENRARIGSNVAEMLWSHDERRARALFALVQGEINSGLNDADDSNVTAHIKTLQVFAKLRTDTLERIASHDPELALDFLIATRLPADSHLPFQLKDLDKQLEVSLAGRIAARSPQVALKLSRQSLENRVSPELIRVLVQLQPKANEAAQTLFREIVQKIRGTNLAGDSFAAEVAVSLAREFQPPWADEVVYRDLIGILASSAVANNCGAGAEEGRPICFAVAPLFPQIEKYQAPRAATLRRLAESSRNYWPVPAMLREVMQNGTPDEILALAPRYPDLNDQIYWSAIAKAEAAEEFVKAKQIASNAPTPELRRQMMRRVEEGESWRALTAERWSTIEQNASRLRDNQQRLDYLFRAARQIRKSDRKAALTLLGQAATVIDSAKPGQVKLGGQIRLAVMYCALQDSRSFTIMESILPRLNEVVGAATVLSGLENNYLRDGEWNMTSEGFVGGVLTYLAQNAGCFAAQDFDRALTLARQFERPELRLMAELRLAQGVLKNRLHPVDY